MRNSGERCKFTKKPKDMFYMLNMETLISDQFLHV